MKKITLVAGCWITNIGNAFLDLGSLESIKQACPKAEIRLTSSFTRWLFNLESKKLLRKKYDKNYFSLMSLINSDYAIFSGMVFSVGFIERYRDEILKMKKKGIKIIFNGAGASQYTKEEVQKFRKFLKEIQPYCFISRDKKSYDFYHDLAEHSFDGIDCAFFINDYFKSANLDIEPYDVYTFDAISEPNIQGDNLNIIRSHHSPGIIPKRSYLNTKKTLISDQPFDYLNLYANAEEVHSDRVHACIVTLAFGNKCQLYSNTLRAHLFEKLGIKISDIRMNPVSLDLKKLKLLKKKQIEFLAKVLNK